jgi:hypothetical protein
MLCCNVLIRWEKRIVRVSGGIYLPSVIKKPTPATRGGDRLGLFQPLGERITPVKKCYNIT